MCHRGQLLDVDYRVCAGPDQRSRRRCDACLGAGRRPGKPGCFCGARAVRAMAAPCCRATPAMLLRRGARSWRADSGRRTTRRTISQRLRTSTCARSAREVTQFLAPSQAHARSVQSSSASRPSASRVAGYGFDRAPFPRSRADDVRSPAAWVSRQPDGVKAPHVLLEALACLPPGAVSVDLFGAHTRVSRRRQLSRIDSRRCSRPDVRLHGPVPHESVPERAGLDRRARRAVDLAGEQPARHSRSVSGRRAGGGLAHRGHSRKLVDRWPQRTARSKPGDVDDLRRAIKRLLTEPELLDALRAGIPAVRSIEDDVRHDA